MVFPHLKRTKGSVVPRIFRSDFPERLVERKSRLSCLLILWTVGKSESPVDNGGKHGKHPTIHRLSTRLLMVHVATTHRMLWWSLYSILSDNPDSPIMGKARLITKFWEFIKAIYVHLRLMYIVRVLCIFHMYTRNYV